MSSSRQTFGDGGIPQYRYELLAKLVLPGDTWAQEDFYDNLENVRGRLNRLFDNLVDLLACKGGLQAINEVALSNLAGEKLAKSVVESGKWTPGQKILQDLLKSKADMLADAVIASRTVFYQ